MLFGVAVVICVLAGWCSPVAAAVCYDVLLQIAAVDGHFRSPLVLISAIAISLVAGLRARPQVSGVCVLTFWYLIQTDLWEGYFFPTDVDTAVFLALVLAAPWAGGVALRNTLLTRARDAERFELQLEEERERTVKALHGSVAASLTSVVLRSEALAMSTEGRTAEASQQIAEDARRAMREVRELIRFMRDDGTPQSTASLQHTEPTENACLATTLHELAEELRGHGFTVVETGINEAALGGIQLAHIGEVAREVRTNILKYADSSRPVIIAAVRDEAAVTVAIQNAIASKQRDIHMTTGIGLADAEALVHTDGAQLTHGYDGDEWRYELVVPLQPSR